MIFLFVIAGLDPAIHDARRRPLVREEAMRAFIQLFGIFLAATPAMADTIQACDADKYVGQLVTVEGVVDEVYHAKSGKVTFVDMCGKFPNNAFAGTLFSDDASKFPDIDSYQGKVNDMTGAIKRFQGRPEIILNDPAQIKAK
jgi:DNA/RNA endonuclease YhcR with UshA esterase domain